MRETAMRPGGTGAVALDAVRHRLSDVAVDLFAEYGSEVVAVEQVALCAGVSAWSVHCIVQLEASL